VEEAEKDLNEALRELEEAHRAIDSVRAELDAALAAEAEAEREYSLRVEEGSDADQLRILEARISAAETQVEAAEEIAGEPVPDAVAADWPQLQAQVAGCARCELSGNRTQTVFGVGDPAADWMIVGEAPGAEEDRQGEPFVGRAGQLLNAILRAVGLHREQVFIANILKCRPPQNRDPKNEEVERCMPYLQRQVELVRPKLIVALGRVAAQNLLGSSEAIGRMRGRVHVFGAAEIPVIVTYHPAYLLRSPLEKRKVWQDMQMALSVAGQVQ
jgi:DNA polymerase